MGLRADVDADKTAADKPASWTIPHTEITLERVADWPRAGQFLFSAETVERVGEFYEKTRALPCHRDVPLQNCAEMRDYLSMAGWLISPRTIAGFPGWLKYSMYRQAVWKWMALAITIAITVVVVVSIHRLAHRGLSGKSAMTKLRRLATPVTRMPVPATRFRHVPFTTTVIRSPIPSVGKMRRLWYVPGAPRRNGRSRISPLITARRLATRSTTRRRGLPRQASEESRQRMAA
jgi:hypothetical protein